MCTHLNTTPLTASVKLNTRLLTPTTVYICILGSLHHCLTFSTCRPIICFENQDHVKGRRVGKLVASHSYNLHAEKIHTLGLNIPPLHYSAWVWLISPQHLHNLHIETFRVILKTLGQFAKCDYSELWIQSADSAAIRGPNCEMGNFLEWKLKIKNSYL